MRPAQEGETPDLNAFTVSVPDEPAVRRGAVGAVGGEHPPLRREIVIVHPRNAALGLILALVPVAVFLAVRGLAARRSARAGT